MIILLIARKAQGEAQNEGRPEDRRKHGKRGNRRSARQPDHDGRGTGCGRVADDRVARAQQQPRGAAVDGDAPAGARRRARPWLYAAPARPGGARPGRLDGDRLHRRRDLHRPLVRRAARRRPRARLGERADGDRRHQPRRRSARDSTLRTDARPAAGRADLRHHPHPPHPAAAAVPPGADRALELLRRPTTRSPRSCRGNCSAATWRRCA